MKERTIEEQFIQIQDSLILVRTAISVLEELDDIPKRYEGDWKFISRLVELKSILEGLEGATKEALINKEILEPLVDMGKAKLETVWSDYKQAIKQGFIK